MWASPLVKRENDVTHHEKLHQFAYPKHVIGFISIFRFKKSIVLFGYTFCCDSKVIPNEKI